MSSAVATQSGRTTAPIGRMLLMQTRAMLLSRLRNPAFTVLSIGLPVMFFLLFNAIFGSHPVKPGVSYADQILAGYATYAVGNIMVFNFGIGLATDRGRKLDLLQRAMPLPPWVAIVAYILFALIFALMALIILALVASLIGAVRFSASTWLDLLWRLLVGCFPLIGMGMAIGYGTSPSTASAVANMVYLPMLFLSGIFVPFPDLPAAVQTVGKLLPTYHYAQLAWGAIGTNTESTEVALAWLAGWTVAMFALAFRVYRLDEDQKFS